MPETHQRFLQPKLLALLGKMELRAATVVEGVMAGLHRSPYRGLSIEFAEYRHYQPGDEPKRIDWKAYARSDRHYIKEFEDEVNLEARIVMDASASMSFGSNGITKWQYTGYMAASLAYLLQSQRDEIGLVVLDEDIRVEFQPKHLRGHLIRLIGAMESVTPSRETRLASVLHRVAAKLRRRGMIIVLSDLLDDPAEVIAALRHLQFGGNDVVVFHLLDPAELRFDFSGPTRFIDPETNAMVPALAEDVKGPYLDALGAFLKTYREELGKTNIAYTLIDTSEPLDRALLAFLSYRMKRK
ncbi:MAG: DUF58 domain-containing protein [Candidatus Hydrogenedentes bacterium]|nr:DUF58 domain-containing protein [Candidatus Hydrogenedentota bacterium]